MRLLQLIPPHLAVRASFLIRRLSDRLAARAIGQTDHRINGEMRVIRQILNSGLNTVVFLDVGANVGRWASDLLGLSDDTTVYCVEVVPTFLQELSQAASPRLVPVPVGLSNRDETRALRVSGKGAGIHKQFQGTAGRQEYEMECHFRLADSVVSELLPTPPDYIKIDVDGMEFAVIEGLTLTIERHRPFVQFEHSPFNYTEGPSLEVFFHFFATRDYVLYLLLPDRVLPIPAYRTFLEAYVNKNILAAPREKSFAVNGASDTISR